MKRAISIFLFLSIVSSVSVAQKKNSKTTKVSYSLSHNPNAENLSSRIALAPAEEPGERMIISGTVYDKDGVTPVKDAVLYLYQTDQRGIYSDDTSSHNPKLFGYLKTDANGSYGISTIRPGHYPVIQAAAHIHVNIKVPGQPEYDVMFQFYDDSRIKDRRRARTDTYLKEFGLIKLMPDDKGILRGVHNLMPPPLNFSLSHNPNAENLSSKIDLAAEGEPGERMIISGTVYEKDGVTPAKDALVYLYQTDQRGVYSDDTCFAACPKLFGYLKTDAKGGYEINTIKPGYYPDIKAARHIHVVVMAPGKIEYDVNFLFYGDSLLADWQLESRKNEDDNFGLIKLLPDDNEILHGIHHIKPFPRFTERVIFTASPQTEKELQKIIVDMLSGFNNNSAKLFRNYSAPYFIYTNESGNFRDKKWAGRYGMRIIHADTVEITDVRMKEYGTTALINFLEIDRREKDGDTLIKKLRSTAVFIKGDTSWQMVSYHSSPVAFEQVVAKVDTKILDEYTGHYEHVYVAAREGNTIVLTNKWGERTVYLPASETEFFTNTEGLWEKSLQTISFVRNAQSKVTHYVSRDNDGQQIIYRKTK